MTEWWLRKAVICHLSPIFCNYYFVYEGTPDVPTYTLRGERDLSNNSLLSVFPISTHTLRGERDSTYCICEVTPPQQSGHFTKNHFKKRYFLHNMYYFFSEPPYKPISLHVRSQNQTALRVICFLCTYMLHSPLPIITQIIESKAILFFINNFHKSIF